MSQIRKKCQESPWTYERKASSFDAGLTCYYFWIRQIYFITVSRLKQ